MFLLLHSFPSWSITSPFPVFSSQRGTMRRRYEDDGISDDEIEGKRTFDLEEKLSTNKFNSTFVVFMEGKGLSWVPGSVCGEWHGSCSLWRAWRWSAACWDTWQPGMGAFAWVSTCNCSHVSATRSLIQGLCGMSPLPFSTHTALWDGFSSHSPS